MIKCKFKYDKKDGSEITEREICAARFVNAAGQSLRAESEKWIFLSGYSLNGLNKKQRKKYEQVIAAFNAIKYITIEQFLKENLLDAANIQFKLFKREGCSDIETL